MDPASNGRRHAVSSRRQWIQACGIAGVAGLAGCLGSDDDDGSDAENAATDSEPADDSGSGVPNLGPADGWNEAHDGVEVPDQPGTAILQIAGERVELTVHGNAGEDPDGMGTTGAEQFEARGAAQTDAFRDSGIDVEFTRVLGYEDTAGTWVESDSVSFARASDGIRLGNVIYRLYDDGTLANAEQAGDLEGRRFVDDSFVHATQEGVITIVEELASHEDDSLDGRFEFGARLQDGWDQFF